MNNDKHNVLYDALRGYGKPKHSAASTTKGNFPAWVQSPCFFKAQRIDGDDDSGSPMQNKMKPSEMIYHASADPRAVLLFQM